MYLTYWFLSCQGPFLNERQNQRVHTPHTQFWVLVGVCVLMGVKARHPFGVSSTPKRLLLSQGLSLSESSGSWLGTASFLEDLLFLLPSQWNHLSTPAQFLRQVWGIQIQLSCWHGKSFICRVISLASASCVLGQEQRLPQTSSQCLVLLLAP